MIYRTRQRNLKIVQHEHKKKTTHKQTKRVILGAPEGWTVPAPLTLVCSCHYKQSNTKIQKMLLAW